MPPERHPCPRWPSRGCGRIDRGSTSAVRHQRTLAFEHDYPPLSPPPDPAPTRGGASGSRWSAGPRGAPFHRGVESPPWDARAAAARWRQPCPRRSRERSARRRRSAAVWGTSAGTRARRRACPGPVRGRARSRPPAANGQRQGTVHGTGAMAPEPVAASGSVMISGRPAATIGSAAPGVATVTRPAPTRSAAVAARTAAPLLPTEPAMTSTCPKSPLCAPALRGGRHAAASSRSSNHSRAPPSSMSRGCRYRNHQLANAITGRRQHVTALRCGKRDRERRRQRRPADLTPSEGRPEGRSTATTGTSRRSVRALKSSITRRTNPVAPARGPFPGSRRRSGRPPRAAHARSARRARRAPRRAAARRRVRERPGGRARRP